MMRYAAIDVETTGLDPERCQILELACVVETDWKTPVGELPRFRALCSPGEIHGDVAALHMNARLIKELAQSDVVHSLSSAVFNISRFLEDHFGRQSFTIAGKNFGAFDYRFLLKSPGWRNIRHKHRFIDVGSMWWNPAIDTCLPSLADCLARASLDSRPLRDAISDCEAVIECVRAFHMQKAWLVA